MSETQLQGRELDAALARALGYVVEMRRVFYLSAHNEYILDVGGIAQGELELQPVQGVDGNRGIVPRYHDDLNAMHDVEAELERRGLGEEYAEALIEELSFPELFYDMPTENISGDEGQETYTSFYGVFQVMHATAEQKARAALAVLSANAA